MWQTLSIGMQPIPQGLPFLHLSGAPALCAELMDPCAGLEAMAGLAAIAATAGLAAGGAGHLTNLPPARQRVSLTEALTGLAVFAGAAFAVAAIGVAAAVVAAAASANVEKVKAAMAARIKDRIVHSQVGNRSVIRAGNEVKQS